MFVNLCVEVCIPNLFILEDNIGNTSTCFLERLVRSALAMLLLPNFHVAKEFYRVL